MQSQPTLRLIKNSVIVGGSVGVDLWSHSGVEHAKACRASHSLQQQPGWVYEIGLTTKTGAVAVFMTNSVVFRLNSAPFHQPPPPPHLKARISVCIPQKMRPKNACFVEESETTILPPRVGTCWLAPAVCKSIQCVWLACVCFTARAGIIACFQCSSVTKLF